jgi:sulfoxide reductase catalytic subunit YedY
VSEHTAANESVAGQSSRRIGRGVFLGTVAGGLSSLWWGNAAWSRVSSALSGVEAAVPLVPSKGWRIYTVADTMPTFDRKTWRLRIGGLVDHPQELSYDDLLALPQSSQVSTFHCVTGWTVQNVHWRGVRFKDLFAQANPQAYARAVQFVSAEVPYIDYLALDETYLKDAMLALEMDGKPLRREHGAPVRVVIPEMFGYKNVKWVSEVNLLQEPRLGYWEFRGYDVDAWVTKPKIS